MELTWYGLSCFRLTERGRATIVTDPYNGKTGLPALKLKGDVVTASNEAAAENIKAVSGTRRSLDCPGEYEMGDVFITGIPTKGGNTLFMFDYGKITVAHTGNLSAVPTQKQIEALGEVNVLLVPVGGGDTLNASQASELISMLEPNFVIPMHFKQPGLKLDLDEATRFLNEMGANEVEPVTSFKVGALPEETQVILLEPKQ